eukprot:TRINITY_DN22844_c0_g1_i1.p1 TRINITY_DN22844_c0_g1~~TRINITY_DN22844_c0_g1_i1.p1  ORF type:complete len:562 (+),score=126.08 TRINITY_DN22844_c0_g1_i1:78-1763(+)
MAPVVGFEVGCRVEASDLKEVAELNGLVGTVSALQGDRIGVDFGEKHGVKALKAENLILVPLPAEKLPVTLLSGFLGAGKTTLLTHLLTNRGGIRVAVLVNDMASINIDESLLKDGVNLKENKDKMVELHNGCICCTLRDDLIKHVRDLAFEQRFDYLLIESTGISEPLPVATTFDARDEQGRKLLAEVARLDTCVTVVDSVNFLKDYAVQEKLVDRKDLGAETGDERTIVDLLTDQIEFANVVILNKTDLVSSDELGKLKGILKKLNPNANVVESQFGVVDPALLQNTKSFDLESARMLPGWMAELKGDVQHTPETEEYGISSFVYRKDRPFHPDRLEKVLASGLLVGVLRSKGYAWVASEHFFKVEWSQAGYLTVLKAPGRWLPEWRGGWPKEAIEQYKDCLYADRRQELVFIGNAMDEKNMRELLDDALLTDEEFALGPQVWTGWTKIVTYEAVQPADADKDREFTAVLKKLSSDDRIGVNIDETEAIRITAINEGGLVSRWNINNPDTAIRVGYKILQVNGIEARDGLKLIPSSQEIRLKVSRLQMSMKERTYERST